MSRSTQMVIVVAVGMMGTAQLARAQLQVNLTPGDFAYQFADPVTGQTIATLTMDPGVSSTAKIAVYLLQTAGSPPNLFEQVGAAGLGVRLLYASPPGI